MFKKFSLLFLAFLHQALAFEEEWVVSLERRSISSAAVSNEVFQELVICSNEKYDSLLKGPLKRIRSLPKPPSEFLDSQVLSDPENLLNFKNWRLFEQGEVLFHKGFFPHPLIAATHSLVDCVGLSITHKSGFYGIAHIDMDSFYFGIFAALLRRFPEEIRATCQVSLTSSHYSPLLRDVLKELEKHQFEVTTADIEDCYLDNSNLWYQRKYVPLSHLGCSFSEAHQLSRNELGYLLSFKMRPIRALIVNLTTNQQYTFFSPEERMQDSSFLFELTAARKDLLKEKAQASKASFKKAEA